MQQKSIICVLLLCYVTSVFIAKHMFCLTLENILHPLLLLLLSEADIVSRNSQGKYSLTLLMSQKAKFEIVAKLTTYLYLSAIKADRNVQGYTTFLGKYRQISALSLPKISSPNIIQETLSISISAPSPPTPTKY